MIICVLSVYDVKAMAFGRPMFVPTRGVGIRMLTDEVNRKVADNLMSAHPEDFRVFELGTFDDASGLFQCHKVPELVVECSALAQ